MEDSLCLPMYSVCWKINWPHIWDFVFVTYHQDTQVIIQIPRLAIYGVLHARLLSKKELENVLIELTLMPDRRHAWHNPTCDPDTFTSCNISSFPWPLQHQSSFPALRSSGDLCWIMIIKCWSSSFLVMWAQRKSIATNVRWTKL